MTEVLAGLLMGVIRFYAWTLGLGLPVLLLITLAESTTDLIRERRRGRGRLDQAVANQNS
jgi:cytochrome c biogenesis protein CcdA